MLIWLHEETPVNGPVLFLDRDGVINHDRDDYVKSRSQWVFYPDALEALAWLKARGVKVILVSNQSGLGRRLIDPSDFLDLREHMLTELRRHQGDLLAEFYCPHRPEDACPCRKPAPGMILAAAKLFAVSLSNTHLIGDKSSDLEAAHNAGCHGLELRRGRGGQPSAPDLLTLVRDLFA